MKIITGTVLKGRVEVPPEVLAEGAHVAILAPDSGSPVRLTPAEEAELVDAVEDLQRGKFVDGMDLLGELRSRSAG